MTTDRNLRTFEFRYRLLDTGGYDEETVLAHKVVIDAGMVTAVRYLPGDVRQETFMVPVDRLIRVISLDDIPGPSSTKGLDAIVPDNVPF